MNGSPESSLKMRHKLKELVMMQECLSPIPKSLMSIEQICSSFISLTCPIWSRKNSIGEKTFYQCMGKVFLLKKKKSILGDPGAGSRVVLKGTGMKVFKHLSRLFSGPNWLPLSLQDGKNVKHPISPSIQYFFSVMKDQT